MSDVDTLKVGDVVLIHLGIRYSLGSEKVFFVRVNIDKITPTQVVIGSDRYRKSDRRMIGGSYRSTFYLIGEVEDETEKCEEFKKVISIVSYIQNIKYDKINASIRLSSDRLIEIKNILTQIQKELNDSMG